MMITFQHTKNRKIFVLFIMVMVMMFIFAGMLTSIKSEYRFSSSSINELAENLTGESLIHVLGFENRYFTQEAPEDSLPPKTSTVAFEMVTSLNPDDPRSLLGRELPGFSLFDGEILVAGEGTNYTNMPYESAPPLEVLMKEREAASESLNNVDKLNESEKAVPPPEITTNGKEVVFIYHTHSRESFLPLLEEGISDDEAYHDEYNIMLVGERLGEELEKRGIGSDVNKDDFTGVLHKNGWEYWQSYEASRPTVEEAIAQNGDLKFFFDLHRDYQPRDITTVTINNKTYARTMFVVGGEHAKYKKNLHLANELHELLDEKYPGLSRGITTKQGPNTNGKFNQDLSENALVIEMGGVDNNLEELYRTAEAIAEVFSEYYWDAEAVNG